MTGTRPRHVLTRLALVLVVAVALVGSACSSSKPKAADRASITTTAASGAGGSTGDPGSSDAAVGKGILVVLNPGQGAKAVAVPAGFTACTAAKLTAADRAVLAKVTNADNVASDLVVRVVRAANTCNRSFLVASFASGLSTGNDAIPGLTAAQASCAANHTLDALVVLDDKTVGTSTDSKVVDAAVAKALDGCYPISGFITSELKQSLPGMTDAQVSCILAELGPTITWGTVMAAGDAFQNQLQSATTGCVGSG